MSSNKAWTGGLANREYRRGTHFDQPVDTGYIEAQVQSYLGDCERFRLERSKDMCLKVVFNSTDAQQQAVKDAYVRLTAIDHP